MSCCDMRKATDAKLPSFTVLCYAVQLLKSDVLVREICAEEQEHFKRSRVAIISCTGLLLVLLDYCEGLRKTSGQRIT